MIYVHRNWDLIPEQVKDDLKRAAAELDTIEDPNARRAYILANQGKWSAVRDYLGNVSQEVLVLGGTGERFALPGRSLSTAWPREAGVTQLLRRLLMAGI